MIRKTFIVLFSFFLILLGNDQSFAIDKISTAFSMGVGIPSSPGNLATKSAFIKNVAFLYEIGPNTSVGFLTNSADFDATNLTGSDFNQYSTFVIYSMPIYKKINLFGKFAIGAQHNGNVYEFGVMEGFGFSVDWTKNYKPFIGFDASLYDPTSKSYLYQIAGGFKIMEF